MNQITSDLSDIDYAVFDDFPWERMKPFAKQWFGAQQSFTVTDKYKSKRTINWGKPIIFLCNPEDHTIPDSDWYQKNSITFFLDNKLF